MMKIILLLFLVKYFIDIPRSLDEKKSKYNSAGFSWTLMLS